jgi:hypothetical protein
MIPINYGKQHSDLAIASFFVVAIVLLSLFGWFVFPYFDRIDGMQRTQRLLPGILRAVNLPAAQAQTVLTTPIGMGRTMISAVDLGIIQAAPDGDHSKVFWSRLSSGVCIGVKVYARQRPDDFNDFVLTVPGQTWRNAEDIQATNCQSLPDHFTLTFERKKP